MKTALLNHAQKSIVEIPNVLVDTGSATIVLAADWVSRVKIEPSPNDPLFTIRGIGGTEVVFTRQLDYLQIGNHQLAERITKLIKWIQNQYIPLNLIKF